MPLDNTDAILENNSVVTQTPEKSGSSRSLFGANMRYFRLRAGLSQEELAMRIGWPTDQVSIYEVGGRTFDNPTLALIRRVADGLGLTPAELVSEPGDRPAILSVSEAARTLEASLHRTRNAILDSGKGIRVASNIYVLETDLPTVRTSLKPLRQPRQISSPKPPRLLRSIEVAMRLKVGLEEAELLIQGVESHVKANGHFYLPEGELAGLRKAKTGGVF